MLLLVGNDDPVVDSSVHELFENPEQVVRRDAEHRRAETAELIERDDGALGRGLECGVIFALIGVGGSGAIVRSFVTAGSYAAAPVTAPANANS